MPYADPAKRKEYHRNYMRSYLQMYPQQYTPEQKEHRKKTTKKRDKKRAPQQWRDYVLRRYGITSDQYEALLTAQGGHCVFCELSIEKNGHRLAVDHDKRTGRVRGILCLKHNAALGMLGDTEAALLKAVEYLRED